MKRFMKGCAVTALIFAVVGMVCAMVGGRMAGEYVLSRTLEEATRGKVRIGYDEFRDWGMLGGWIFHMMDIDFDSYDEAGSSAMDERMDYGYETEQYEDGHEVDFSYDRHVFSGDVERFCPGEDIRNLDIDMGGCCLQTADSPDDRLYLEVQDAYKFQGYVEDGTLYVKSTSRMPANVENCCITLYLPEGYRFHEVEVELGAGQLDFGALYADSASMEVGAGQITVYDRAEISELEAAVGIGAIDFGILETDELEVEVGMGTFMVTEAAIKSRADVECAMGSVDMTLRGRERDFNYEMHCAMGGIDLGGWNSAGLGQEQHIDNGASREIKLECSMGYIEIRFTD